jgi:hypothetical protein
MVQHNDISTTLLGGALWGVLMYHHLQQCFYIDFYQAIIEIKDEK